MLPGQYKIWTTAENILNAEPHDVAIVPGSVKRAKTSRAQNGFVSKLFPTKMIIIRPFDQIVASQVKDGSIGPMKAF